MNIHLLPQLFQPKTSALTRRVIACSCLVFVLLFLAVAPAGVVLAQDAVPDGPVYIVKEGDTLWAIAQRFGVTMEALANANNITNTSQLALGAQLVIPGLEGIQGVLVTESVAVGESLRSLSRKYQTSEEALIRLNHLTSPSELYVGYSLIIPEQNASAPAARRAALAPGQSLLEVALLEGSNPWEIVAGNQLSGTWSALPGDVLFVAGDAQSGPGVLPGEITAITLTPQQMGQGRTAVLQLSGPEGMTLTGSLGDRELNFFPDEKGGYVAMQGIHAMTVPGLYPLTVSGSLPDGTPFAFSQGVFIRSENYPFDPVLIVKAETIDPAVTGPEDAQWFALAGNLTPEKLWDGVFLSPAPEPYVSCWPSYFGSRRSYNGSEYSYFHSGLDYCGGVGTEILAPAAGRVVFSGPLTVRGNATVIDHGWGVFTGYMHQSENLVQAGENVEAGQVIGLVGGTGRVTGPHLHWEVFVGGVQVDPMDWLEETFP